jgi:RNA polymerase sigma factor (sigma-70 family)
MDSKEKRDCVFVYIWVLSKIVAATSCRDGGDKIYVETALIEGLMGQLDKGAYSDEKGHLLGWSLLLAATIIRNALAHCYISRLYTVDIDSIPDGKSSALVSQDKPVEELVDLANIEDMIYLLHDDDQVRVLWMYFIDGMTQQEIAGVMDIGDSTVSRIYTAGIDELNKLHNEELSNDIK